MARPPAGNRRGHQSFRTADGHRFVSAPLRRRSDPTAARRSRVEVPSSHRGLRLCARGGSDPAHARDSGDVRRHRADSDSAGTGVLHRDLQNGRGTAGMLLRDEAVAGQVRQAVANAHAATADLGQATRKADALMTDLGARQIPQKAGELVDHLRDSAQQLHQITSDISKPDPAGMSAGANITASLTNVNVATANLADVTEAAKHNFLLRGFFNKEGLLQPGGYVPGKVSPGWRLHETLEPANLAVRPGAVPERVERGGTVREGKGGPARRSHTARRIPCRPRHCHRGLRKRRRPRR